MAIRRLAKYMRIFSNDPPPLCYAEPVDNDMFHWNGFIIGPPESPYEGIALFLDIHMPTDYPFKPPKIHFIFPIYHPNVNEFGSLCMHTECDPALSLDKRSFFGHFFFTRQENHRLISISSVLSDPLLDGTPLNLEAAKMYQTDRENYNQLAKDSCQKHISNPEYQKLYAKFFSHECKTSI